MNAIDHIVVLMLENRSFDNMLGALSLPPAQGGLGRGDVNGLTGSESNQYNGANYPVFPLPSTRFRDGPCHESACVQRQLRHENGGFVFDFEGVRQREPLGAVMGYYPTAMLPVYEFLSREFVVCDRWHSSVPGPTWPNRLYSIAGQSDGQHGNSMPHVGYGLKTIFEHLHDSGVSWGYYSHDRVFSFLRVFRRFLASSEIRPFAQFYQEAAANSLPSVVWLEPEFGTRPGTVSNDDHPPGDLLPGQQLVAKVYNALRSSAAWPRTLLILTYDEHGGFYDHVVPPAAPDDRTDFQQYGLRVPAFLVSPLVPQGAVDDRLLDHTSILRTILDRFCTRNGQSPSMGARTDHAANLMGALSLTAPRDTPRSAPNVSLAPPASATTTPAPSTAEASAFSDHVLMRTVGGLAVAAGIANQA
ncbi:MAG TPA: alkaline phosphatase family protein [Gemmatimonadaceae bacterium]|nr:alkaline phosphatase family protein [Gemmatimonadaceae bacterium]